MAIDNPCLFARALNNPNKNIPAIPPENMA